MVKVNNAQEPAFSAAAYEGIGGDRLYQPGLTKRELFAAMAMQGLLVEGHGGNIHDLINALPHKSINDNTGKVACASTLFADALLAALEKQP